MLLMSKLIYSMPIEINSFIKRLNRGHTPSKGANPFAFLNYLSFQNRFAYVRNKMNYMYFTHNAL